MWILILVVFIVVIPILSALSGLPGRQAVQGLEEGEFGPVRLLPAALAMESILPNRLRTWETERLMPRIILLHGTHAATRHMQVHLAAKCLGGWMGAAIAAFLGLAGSAGLEWLPALPVGFLLMYGLADRQLDERYHSRCRELERAFPGFVSKMALLVGAGLHVRQAIVRIVQEQEGGERRQNALHRELAVVLADIEAGMSEQQAYNELSERCRIREISNFTGILLQHMRLGGSQLMLELRRMSTESWELRKHSARRYAEEASSKLVFPLVLMFLAVVLVSIAPAFLSIGALQ